GDLFRISARDDQVMRATDRHSVSHRGEALSDVSPDSSARTRRASVLAHNPGRRLRLVAPDGPPPGGESRQQDERRRLNVIGHTSARRGDRTHVMNPMTNSKVPTYGNALNWSRTPAYVCRANHV